MEAAALASSPDREAWFIQEVFIHRRSLRGFLSRWRRGAHDVDDLCQETFLRFFKAYSAVRPGNAKTALFQIARNLLIDVVRRETVGRDSANTLAASISLHGYIGGDSVDFLDPERYASAASELAAVESVLDELSPRRREVLRLRRVDGLSEEETAAKLNISPRTVEQHLRYANEQLQAQFGI